MAMPQPAEREPGALTIETTMQRSGKRLRAHVRLASADPSAPVWATQLDFSIDSSFAAQDSLASRVVQAVAASMARTRNDQR
jgi:TolB-like protein